MELNMNQLVRFTNAYSGDFVYVALAHIVSFHAHTTKQPERYKETVNMWILPLGGDGAIPVVEEVNYLLAKFPPL